MNSEPQVTSTTTSNSILATRTLTTLISTLESAPTIRPTSRFEYSTPTTGNNRDDAQELRIYNAFATLLSRHGENVTIASRMAIQKQTNDVNVDLVVCFDIIPPELVMGSRQAEEKDPFLVNSARRHPEEPYSLIELDDHAGVGVTKGPHAFVKECL